GGLSALAFHPNGTLYGVTNSSSVAPGQLVVIDKTTGAATPIEDVIGSSVTALTFTPNSLYLISQSGRLLRIDLATGARVVVGGASFLGGGIAASPTGALYYSD